MNQQIVVLFGFLFMPTIALMGCHRLGGRETNPPPVDVLVHPSPDSFSNAYRTYADARKRGLNAVECERAVRDFKKLSDSVARGVPEALFNAGMIWEECGHREKASEFFLEADRSARRHKAEGFAPALIQLGVYAYHNDEKTRAQELFKGALKADRRSVHAYENLAALNLERGEWKGAQLNLRRSLALSPKSLNAYSRIAVLYLRLGDDYQPMLDMAALVCKQAIALTRQHETDPQELASVHNLLGLALIRKGEVTEAVESFSRARQLDSKLFSAQMNYGAVNLSFRGYEAAEEAFRAALEVQPQSYDANLSLGVALRGLNRLDEATAAYEEAQSLNPQSPGSYYNLAVLMQDHQISKTDNLDEQLRLLTKARQGYQRFIELCQHRPQTCVLQMHNQTPVDLRESAQQRIESCNETITGLREARQLTNKAI